MIDEGKILSRHELRNKNSKLTISIIIFLLGLSFVIISVSLTTAIFQHPLFFQFYALPLPVYH